MKDLARATSRRTFVRLLVLAPIAVATTHRAGAQRKNTEPPSGSPHLRPVREFRGAFLKAVSTDGRKMCVALASEEVQTWTYGKGEWNQEAVSAFPRGALLSVVEIESGKPTYSTKL